MDADDDVRQKVAVIFTELTGERALRLAASKMHGDVMSTITAALSEQATEAQYLHNDEISFNLSDWAADAAFLVALHLYPERFSPKEIRDGIGMFMVHVPEHISELNRLMEGNLCP